ncbi:GDP-fucose protein O-fucosyltransferase 1 [Schistosoma japonicum]|nr:GDP-fucose protein O-fucosyltransferase 1 [Schistosoma japonicum]KAH8859882.1 GDP-fucose protein O-fucosyltransferase 1 [Schistosoma japonicum]KAH8859883.1 GDP-fucose protein O-fucosyltransferase 1 [Schistosoma japonicum]KAH8859884.1 GDP-fucose protein O-fucosyltransferase 1 [Schistosoma japonicum]KAH8859886.1 GDP-fucose protein O-fucosyltransferase 1 [Schistosoma japonicum]
MKIDGMKFILCVILIECQYVMQYSIAYITYCPCMGRLGNQIEQFLGMIAFAIRINRTLVLPPWNIMSSLKANFVPFENLFNITKLLLIHQFVSQENFMLNKAPLLWPTTKRTAICFRPRPGPLNNDCNAKDGNPFKEFWDTFNVSFTDSSFYFPLSADDPKEEWDRLFPPNIYPVLAFVGPPSSFPVRPENRIFHRYLEWNSHINVVTESFISRWLEKPIVGVHLRNGEDFLSACSHLKSNLRMLFSSAQCHGDFNELPPYKVTEDMCVPSKKLVLRTISYGVRIIKAKSVYVSTDNDPMLSLIRCHLSNTTVKHVVWKPNRKPEEDMALLGRIDLAILNCVSTYSASIKRERDVNNLPSMFFGLTNENQRDLEVLCNSTGDTKSLWWS